MSVNLTAYKEISKELEDKAVLVAVSKIKPVSDIQALYNAGQRDFGENYVQELIEKQPQLPQDVRWHFIGHLQSNKVKQVIPFVHLIHGVDSVKLLQEINKQSARLNKITDCLLQVHIAQEETKFGFDEQALEEIIPSIQSNAFPNVRIRGLMGMASFSDDNDIVRQEFQQLSSLFKECQQQLGKTFNVLSMGMSGDYSIAIEEGSNMVRIGSLLFGARG